MLVKTGLAFALAAGFTIASLSSAAASDRYRDRRNAYRPAPHGGYIHTPYPYGYRGHYGGYGYGDGMGRYSGPFRTDSAPITI